MAHLRCDFHSDILGLSTSMTVLLPQRTTTQIGMSGSQADDGGTGDVPVLYLLHGLSDDDTIWLRRTSIERYVAPLGLAVVMPQVHRSFYADQEYGGPYWTFLSEELPSLVGDFFRLSQRREDTFVAGLSMGGYGAFRWALQAPERFAAAASLSGVLDLALRRDQPARPEDPRQYERIFGDSALTGTDHDLLSLIERADPAALPQLYICCGTQDPVITDNRTFAAACAAADVPVTVDFADAGHEWGYWDATIQDVLAWLPLRNRVRESGNRVRESASDPS